MRREMWADRCSFITLQQRRSSLEMRRTRPAFLVKFEQGCSHHTEIHLQLVDNFAFDIEHIRIHPDSRGRESFRKAK